MDTTCTWKIIFAICRQKLPGDAKHVLLSILFTTAPSAASGQETVKGLSVLSGPFRLGDPGIGKAVLRITVLPAGLHLSRGRKSPR
jgi:hypothetical protein